MAARIFSLRLPVRLFVAGIGFCGALVAAGWLSAASTGVAAGPVMSPPPAVKKAPVTTVAKLDTAPAAQPEKKKSTITAVRPPVPLLPSPRHTEFFSDETQPATTPTIATLASAATPDGQDKVDTADAGQAARKMIEADGYKNVSGLAKAPDGTWTGYALRGTTRISIKVDATGNVSAN